MIQLTQNLKDGTMELNEVPTPSIEKNQLLIKVHYSAISAGTEGKTVKDARAGYIEKAKARQDEVKKVIKSAKQHGIMKTYQMVMDKLEAPSPLGYSCSGEVIKVGDGINHFKVGDLVACGGTSASHAEVVAVPKNLCVGLRNDTNLEHASFTTIGAIALQGIRQAELSLGENCVVVGLGLIGQLTIQILKAAGIEPIGIDLDDSKIELSKKFIDHSFNRNDELLEDQINQITNGYGTDAVIITAGTSSNDPIELAGQLCRKKGKVIIVGNVPTGFSRKNYFKKELDLRMSSSYGPGRYDSNYEEKGLDYPIGYVRWTENRNMEAFAKLVGENKIDIQSLISHQYQFEESIKAYDMIMSSEEPYLGITLKYDTSKSVSSNPIQVSQSNPLGKINIGFIGAGSFAKNFLLPNINKNSSLVGVATSRPHTGKNIASKYGFNFCTCEADDILNDESINTVFIATRHNSHEEYTIKALKKGKSVFVEKPLAINEHDLIEIESVAQSSQGKLFVGYNRRFSPLIKKLISEVDSNIPKVINYKINASNPPSDHWTLDNEIGGGRILGEVCHFVDLAMFIAQSKITNVSAMGLNTTKEVYDSCIVNLSFENGSIASISYVANGHQDKSKEFLEVYCGKKILTIDDFNSLQILGGSNKTIKLSNQDKGHKTEIETFLNSIQEGKPSPISLEELLSVSKTTFAILKSCNNNGESITIE